jgi:hypothetical protein
MGRSAPSGVSAGAAAGADAEVVRGFVDDEQSPLAGAPVEGRVVDDLCHMRERIGQHVVLSFVCGGRAETLELPDSPADDRGYTMELRVPAPR